jgi:hypothetical protein
LIEYDLRGRAGIGAADDDGERMLFLGDEGPLNAAPAWCRRFAFDEAAVAFPET